MPKLLEHIGNGKMKPELIITHRMALSDAVLGYEILDERKHDYRKVILTP